MLPLAEHETIKFPCVCGIPAFFLKKKKTWLERSYSFLKETTSEDMKLVS